MALDMKIMSKKEERMEKLIAIGLITYSIGLLIGEELRKLGISEKNRKQYSGLYVLLYKANKMKEEIIELGIKMAYEVLLSLVGT